MVFKFCIWSTGTFSDLIAGSFKIFCFIDEFVIFRLIFTHDNICFNWQAWYEKLSLIYMCNSVTLNWCHWHRLDKSSLNILYIHLFLSFFLLYQIKTHEVFHHLDFNVLLLNFVSNWVLMKVTWNPYPY